MWTSLGLIDELVDCAENEQGWFLPTPVQVECIPRILNGGDVVVSAETGSGKTCAFALPAIQICYEYQLSSKNERPDKLGALKVQSLQFEMSLDDRDKSVSIHPSSSGLHIQTRNERNWVGCRCNTGIGINVPSKHNNETLAKKLYFECTIKDEGAVRLGYSTAEANLNLGMDKNGWGYGGTGFISHDAIFEPYQENEKVSFGKGDVVGCLFGLDDDEITLKFSKNGNDLGSAFEFPAEPLELYPTISMRNAECSLNFGITGMKSFAFPPEDYEPFASLTRVSGGVSNPCLSLSRDNYEEEGPLIIVLAPQRELAQQIYQTFATFSSRLSKSVNTALLVGGVDNKMVQDQLKSGLVEILVGTPIIISYFIKKGKIQTSRCKTFILDEADQLLDKENSENVRYIFSRIPRGGKSVFDRLQVCFFSATLQSKKVRDLIITICHRPIWVDLRGEGGSILPETVEHLAVYLNPNSINDIAHRPEVTTDAVHRGGKIHAIVDIDKLPEEEQKSELIKATKPHVVAALIDKFKMNQVLVFCRTNQDCDLLERYFILANKTDFNDKYSCKVLAGMKTMEERQSNLNSFKDGEIKVLICTDIASRGIDINELPFIINVTLPNKKETYLHRCGRVGRAEKKGLAISIVATMREKIWFCKKGLKPPCADTRLYVNGGNCVWQNESLLLKGVEELFPDHKKIIKLNWPELHIPAGVSFQLKANVYGKGKDTMEIDLKLQQYMHGISEKVEKASNYDFNLQADYWALKNAQT